MDNLVSRYLRDLTGEPATNESSSNLTALSGCASNDANKSFDQISFVIAISLALLAAISNNLGVNFQKLAWTKKQKGTSSVRTYRLIWISGMLGIILASVFDFVALAFGPQSVIAPLGAMTMVMNACVAPYMHGERLPKIVYLATIVIVSGCAMAVASASHENIICNLDGIFAFYLTAQSIVYFIFVTCFACGVFLFIRYAERILEEFKNDSDEYQKIFKLHRISYALVAGLMGAQSVVFARALGMMFQASARGDQIFLARGQTYGILLGLIASIVVQLAYLNKGLARFESTYNVPVFTGTFIVGTAISGGVVYGEFDKFTGVQAALFPLGILMSIFGVALLARGGSAMPDDASAATSDEDEEKQQNQHNSNSLIAVSEMKSMETSINPQFIPQIPQPDVRIRELQQKQKNASLRIRSGGFIPFVIEENSHRRTSSTASRPRARTDTYPHGGPTGPAATNASLRPNWLLGIRIDEEEDYVREGSTPSY